MVNTTNPAESVSDRQRRDAKRMNLSRRNLFMKITPIALDDVGKILVVGLEGESPQIMTADAFALISTDDFDYWDTIVPFDVEQR